ncbi:MAG: molybdopterin-dependent oxidoreductase [Lachnospiraceae bacterium]|nr:molybdopterin-dependent oxidoreductase [Lachnospiraceae bacterium]
MAFEIRKSFCSICSRGCGMDVWVKDDQVIKIEPSNFQNGGQICVKGYAYKDYIFREDRIKTPVRRVGERGSGQWEPISWEEAYEEIAGKLLGLREQYGADSVMFYTGYSKWYRPVYHRFIHSFGTLNYGTESSTCHQSYRMGSELLFGTLTRPDMANSDLFIGWAYNPFYNGNYQNLSLEDFREKGGKVLVIDPRVTPAAKFADIVLRPDSGTDGALANFFGNYLIQQGKTDSEYITAYVHGFSEYKKYVKKFTLEKTAQITNIPEKQLLEAAELIAASPRFSVQVSGAAIPHHTNGMQNVRAILALTAITGNFDREGGILPVEYSREAFNTKVLWDQFVDETRPLSEDGGGYQNSSAWHHQNPDFNWEGRKLCRPKIGSSRFPVWSEIVDECQSMDLTRQILEETPYPIKAVFALGMNRRMFIDNEKLMGALKKLDFFVDVDLFWTDAAKVADIVLPACSSFERSELITAGSFIRYVEPAIKPLYQSKSDVDIISELAEQMKLDDKILRSGYEGIVKYALRRVGVTLDSLKASPGPIRIPGKMPYFPGRNLADGLRTPTGKIELYSETIAKFKESHGLEPLPVYDPPLKRAGKKKYPFILTAGGRIPTEFHSRYQNVKSAKFLRPYPAADLNPEDAEVLGIRQDDPIVITTDTGSIHVRANLTHMAKKGIVFMYQSYENADVNRIIDWDHLDPYSGFPGYRTVRCSIRKEEQP